MTENTEKMSTCPTCDKPTGADPKCEDCRGTGFYGDRGPGVRYNREFQPCECMSRPTPGRGAARDVLAERERQKSVEGWTEEHDDEHGDGQLADAAACYLLEQGRGFMAEFWPWDMKWWKPKERRRNLVRAGALILAEIERIERAQAGKIVKETP